MKSTQIPPSRTAAAPAPALTPREEKIERLNHVAFFLFMGALLIGFIVVALAAVFYW